MKIKLTKNLFAIIDKEDFDKVRDLKWHAQKHKKGHYAYHRCSKLNCFGKRDSIAMHRLVMNLPVSRIPVVDHINGETLDNRKVNLRVSSVSQNLGNVPKRKGLTSKYKGVRYSRGKWEANIARKYLGRFDIETDAAKMYDKAARKHFGEFAYLNFPNEEK